ncbi:GHKL domain-containing protein [Streptococcus penaeicida]
MNRELPIANHLFYSFAACTISDFISRIIGYVILPTLFHQTSAYLSTHFWYLLLAYSLVLPTYAFIHYVLHIDYQIIQRANREIVSKTYRLMNISMIIFYGVVQLSTFLEYNFPQYTFLPDYHRYLIIYVYILIFLWGILNLNQVSSRMVALEIDDERKKHYYNLANYNHYLESLYHETSDFRDKTRKGLLALEDSVKSGDQKRIKKDYQDYILANGSPFNDQKYNMDKLVNIKVATVKSLLSAKIFQAQKLGLTTEIEIPDIITSIPIKELDFVIILSIFIDNAIEAAIDSLNKQIKVALFFNGDDLVLLVENTSKEEKINLNKIYLDGFSTKGSGRGLGLANVMKILNRYPFCTLSTKSREFVVTQQLTILNQAND